MCIRDRLGVFGYVVIENGRAIRFASKFVEHEVHVVGDAGWGYTEMLGPLGSALNADVTTLAQTADEPGAGAVLRIDDELLLVTAAANDNWTISRGVGGTTRVEHDAGTMVWRVRPPELLEAAARGIAASFKVREKEPGRGVSRAVPVQDGFRLVRTDPLAAFRRDLDEYRR